MTFFSEFSECESIEDEMGPLCEVEADSLINTSDFPAPDPSDQHRIMFDRRGRDLDRKLADPTKCPLLIWIDELELGLSIEVI